MKTQATNTQVANAHLQTQTCNEDLQRRLATKTCNEDWQPQTCNADLQRREAGGAHADAPAVLNAPDADIAARVESFARAAMPLPPEHVRPAWTMASGRVFHETAPLPSAPSILIRADGPLAALRKGRKLRTRKHTRAKPDVQRLQSKVLKMPIETRVANYKHCWQKSN